LRAKSGEIVRIAHFKINGARPLTLTRVAAVRIYAAAYRREKVILNSAAQLAASAARMRKGSFR
jgi:hypothetical protein